jgi:indolepyruvate ferredoxin oxidoreductase alpha subunit
MVDIAMDAPGKAVLLMGNEAIARGALEAGIGLAASYPGTPASEIMDSLAPVARKMSIYAEWSVNEMVALEAAAGASMGGIRAIASMKQDGVNVAADFLSNIATIGIGKGGLVLVTGDDPSALSSGREKDMRNIAKWYDIPMLEPANIQEAKDMTRCLFDLSEELGLLCMLRSVTRIGHGRGTVKLGELPRRKLKACFDDVHDIRKPKPSRYVPFPPALRYAEMEKKFHKARELSESSSFNWYEGPDKADLLLITSGGGYLYAKEAVKMLKLADSVGILKVGTVWPLPEKLMREHLNKVPKVLVIEEVSPFLEERAMEMAGNLPPASPHPVFYGRHSGHIKTFGELSPDAVIKALASIMGLTYQPTDMAYSKKAEASKSYVPARPVTICPGCPHRASLWAIKKALKLDGRNGFLTGDIGCYFTGWNASGFFQIRTGHCMGGGIGVANGLGRLGQFGFTQPVLAACGDSTFFHAAIPALINGIWNQSNFVLVILDNSATAMTGFQAHPGTGMNAMGEPARAVSMEALCRSLGLRVEICDPFDLENTTSTLLAMIKDEGDGARVVILRRECELIRARREKPPYKVYIDSDKCIGEACGCNRFCNTAFTCQALAWDKKAGRARIDEVICAGCGLCADICPQGAIIREAS